MRYLPILLLAAYPLAVAGQNTVSAIALLIALIVATKRRWAAAKSIFLDPKYLSLICFVMWGGFSTWFLRGESGAKPALDYVVGFLPFLMLPPLLNAYLRPTDKDWHLYFKVLVGVVATWAVIATTQAIWGWRLAGDGIQYGYYRAQALYSHPLTFAYATLLLWPVALGRMKFAPKSVASWILLLGVAACLWFSESRTVQLVALLIAVADVLLYVKKYRWLVIGVMIIAVTYAAIGDHQLGQKLRATAAGTADRQSDYADDRLAFWHAYSKLVREAPLVGHGVSIEKEKVHAAYAEIGLENFTKKYPAHNTYLQTWAENGLIGLLLFVWWIATYLTAIFKERSSNMFCIFEWQVWVAILLASFTQNAFQDSEVRYGFMLLCIYRALQERR